MDEVIGHIHSCVVTDLNISGKVTGVALDDAALKAKIDDVSKLRFGLNISDIDKARLISALVKYHEVFQWHDCVVKHRIDT